MAHHKVLNAPVTSIRRMSGVGNAIFFWIITIILALVAISTLKMR